jgi:phosphomannomutase
VIKDGVKLNIDSIHNTVNPGFGGLHPEPIEANLTELKDRLKQGKYLCGFGTDGDADRLAMFDERGNYISPHKIMALLTYHLVKNKGLSGGLATTVSGSRLLINLAAKYNLKVFETPVGFKHIGGLFNTEDILIGGEESGGIAIKTAIPERDGLLNSLLILELIATENKPISQILSDIENENGKYYYRRLDLNIASLDTAKVKEKLGNFNVSIFDRAVVKTDRKDGIKFIFSPDMFLLIRSSGTEPLLRIYAESLSPTTTDKLIESVKNYIESN